MVNRTKIEWVKNPDGSQGYTWNPITGCLNQDNGFCKGGGFPCYAYKLANGRLKPLYLANNNGAPQNDILDYGRDIKDPFYPRFWEERLRELSKRKQQLMDGEPKAMGVFVCDMGDLFGIGVPVEWTTRIMDAIWDNDEYDRFYLLTKQPQNLIKFSPFPENCFVGVTITNQKMFDEAIKYLKLVDAKVKFLSLEPLLNKIDISLLIGYNAEHEGEKQRSNSLRSSEKCGIGNRQRGKDLENQSPEVRQVAGWQQSNTMQSAQSRERHGEVSPSKNYDSGDKILCTCQPTGMVSLQGANTDGVNSQSQKREREGQSPREFRTSDLQSADNTFNNCAGENVQTGQARPISWIIIGACTGTEKEMTNLARSNNPFLTEMPCGTKWTAQPNPEWVREIVEAVNKAGIRVFLKDNLRPLLIPEDSSKPNYLMEDIFWASEKAQLRQEMPNKDWC